MGINETVRAGLYSKGRAGRKKAGATRRPSETLAVRAAGTLRVQGGVFRRIAEDDGRGAGAIVNRPVHQTIDRDADRVECEADPAKRMVVNRGNGNRIGIDIG